MAGIGRKKSPWRRISSITVIFLSMSFFMGSAHSSQEGGNVMVVQKNEIISAQVILPSASRKTIDGEVVVTSENISDYAPSSEAVMKAQDMFRAKGFDVGNVVGISFSISAPVEVFENTFKLRVRKTASEGFEFIQADGSGSGELPKSSLALLPGGIAQAVIFVKPPDFGPSDFSM